MRSGRGEPEPDGHDTPGRWDDAAAGGGAAGGGWRCEPAGGDPDAAAEPEDVSRLVADVRAADRHVAAAVMRAGRLASSGVAEAQAGLPVEQVLVTACRLTGADRHTLVTAGRVLGSMPVLRGLFETGQLSWGEVRGIVSRAKRLSRGRLAWLDARLAATIEQRDGLSGFDPDDLVDAVGDAVDELTDLDRLERHEREAIATSFLSIQPDFFGGVRAYGEFDAQITAPILDALQAASPAPHAGDAAPDTDGAGRDHGTGHTGPVTARTARPQLTVTVTLDQATAAVAGHVDLAAGGPLPRLTATAVEALACCGDVQAVVVDGARPLAATQKVTAGTVPAATRRAVEARDQGCRWPGCQAPLAHCDLHHLLPRSHHGDHHPENLAALCRRHHTQLHACGWQLEVDGDTGAMVGWRHGRRRWTSQPPTARLAHPQTPAGDDNGVADTDSPTGHGHPAEAPAQREPPSTGDGRDPPNADPPDTDHVGDPLPF